MFQILLFKVKYLQLEGPPLYVLAYVADEVRLIIKILHRMEHVIILQIDTVLIWCGSSSDVWMVKSCHPNKNEAILDAARSSSLLKPRTTCQFPHSHEDLHRPKSRTYRDCTLHHGSGLQTSTWAKQNWAAQNYPSRCNEFVKKCKGEVSCA